jgi:excisionase family DNA binding protein
MEQMPELMTLHEVAKYLRVTTKTVSRMLQSGKIPATKVGRQWRFNKSSIQEWLNKKTSGIKARILVVDDEEIIRKLLEETLRELGHSVYSVSTAKQALDAFRIGLFDLVYLDLKMPEMDGAQLFHELKTLYHNVNVIIITGYPDSEIMSRALAVGPFSVMNKPFGYSDIIDSVNSYLKINK